MLGVTFSPGFFFSSLGGNGTTSFVVNVCGHDSVGWPLARNMDPIDERYLEEMGLENLIIPISVSEPKKLQENYDYAVNVVVHTCLTQRIRKSFRLCGHYIERLTVLAIQWIKQECGVQLIEHSCKLLGLQKGYDLNAKAKGLDSKTMEKISQSAEALVASLKQAQTEGKEQHVVPEELVIKGETNKSQKKPLIQEVSQEPGIKKGFLSGSKQTLYGPEGSKEGDGPTMDPLAHIPASLRNKCTIVDTRDMSIKGPGEQKASIKEDVPAGQISNSFKVRESEKRLEAAVIEEWKVMDVTDTKESVTVVFSAPSQIVSMKDVNLQVTSSQIILDGVIVPLPREINCDGVKAKFVKSKKSLVITCPSI